MKRKGIKIILVLLMLLGITISILNFLPTELEAQSHELGYWEYFDNGARRCVAPGDSCVVGMLIPK